MRSVADDRKGKLLFVVTEDWVFWSHRAALAAAARAQGWKVLLACRFQGHQKDILNLGIHAVALEVSRGSLSPWTLFSEVLTLSGVLKREKPDLVHCIGLRSIVVGSMASRFAGSGGMIHSLTGLGHLFAGNKPTSLVAKILKAMLPWLLKNQVVVVQNREDLRWLQNLGLSRRSLRMIRGSGVDVTKFRPRRPPPGPPIVMFPARLVRDKGLGEFLEAAGILKRLGFVARFVLVGKPDPLNPTSVLEKELNAWGRDGIVEVWGHQEKMEKIIPQASVVCLPSYREGLPKSLLEGMACGLPCVATRTSGCREAVRHGVNGLLVPVRNPKALAGALSSLLRNKKKRLQMGQRGRLRAEQEFAEPRIIGATLNLYREILRLT